MRTTVSCWALLGIATALATSGAQQQGKSEQRISIISSSSEVRMVLSVPRRALWRWRAPETPDNALEYSWVVALDSNENRGFGFMLFKFPGSAPASGTLAELLRAGQRSVWETTSPHLERVVIKGRIALAAADSGVAVTITDPWTINFLFGSRPQVAYLRMQSPSDSYASTRVRLEYVSP